MTESNTGPFAQAPVNLPPGPWLAAAWMLLINGLVGFAMTIVTTVSYPEAEFARGAQATGTFLGLMISAGLFLRFNAARWIAIILAVLGLVGLVLMVVMARTPQLWLPRGVLYGLAALSTTGWLILLDERPTRRQSVLGVSLVVVSTICLLLGMIK